MYTTVNESGQINNYANEPEMYYSYYPSNWEQGRYAKLGALATVFIGVVLMTAVVVTSIA